MCKINFVCNPRIIVYSDTKPGDPFGGESIELKTLLKSDLWNKQLIHEIISTQEYPATIFEIVLTRNEFIYNALIRYWDGVGVYEIDVTYDHDDRRIEAERNYITL